MGSFFNNSSENHKEGYDDNGFVGNDVAGGPGKGFYNNDYFSWGTNTNSPAVPLPNKRPRYSDAYGDYMGGYSPGGGFGQMPPMPAESHKTPKGSTWPFGDQSQSGPGLSMQKSGDKENIINYLMKCGVPKNLLSRLLALYCPKHCKLCNKIFLTDTSAKLHYKSKKHLYKQKNWIIFEGLLRSTPEMPFISRDFYCELCDVRITSESHGESHYKGKIHLRIVEGLSMPKNPKLLQSEMQQRLKGLIQREKCSIAKEAAKDDKNGSELYCAVCKIMVTCRDQNDQMIAHRNGRKHFLKEKRQKFKAIGAEENEEEYGEQDEVEIIEPEPECVIVIDDDDDDDECENEAIPSRNQIHTTAEDWM